MMYRNRIGITADSILENAKAGNPPATNPPSSMVIRFEPALLVAQEDLKRAGFYPGTPTGYNDGVWLNAVREFKNMAGLPIDSEFDQKTAGTLALFLRDGRVPGQRYKPVKRVGKARPPGSPPIVTQAPNPGGAGQPATGTSLVKKMVTALLLTSPAWGAYLYTRFRG